MMEGMNRDVILKKDAEGIATIVLNRPEKLNAFTMQMIEELVEITENVAKDKQVKVVVLTGAGRGFCAGHDFSEVRPLLEVDVSLSTVEGLRSLGLIVTRIRNMPKPWIAMVNGPAMGPGCGFAIACDIIIASEEAKFGMVFSRMGLHPECGLSYLLPRLIGLAKASELLLTAKTIDAKEAEHIGLVSRVVPPDRLADTTRELAINLAKGPSLALGLTKTSLTKGWDQGLSMALEREALVQGILVNTEDRKEAGNAFREKRQPVFRGR